MQRSVGDILDFLINLLLVLLIILFYFMPAMLAAFREHRRQRLILWINLLFGWSFFMSHGFTLALLLIWAAWPKKHVKVRKRKEKKRLFWRKKSKVVKAKAATTKKAIVHEALAEANAETHRAHETASTGHSSSAATAH